MTFYTVLDKTHFPVLFFYQNNGLNPFYIMQNKIKLPANPEDKKAPVDQWTKRNQSTK